MNILKSYFSKVTLLFSLTLSLSVANASQMPSITDKKADEIINCAVYFLIYSAGLEKSGGTDSMKKAEVFIEYSKTLTMLIGKLKSKDYVIPRFKSSQVTLTNEMNKTFKDFDVINKKYHKSCLQVVETSYPKQSTP